MVAAIEKLLEKRARSPAQKQEKSFATKKSRKNAALSSYRLLLVRTGPGAPVRPFATDLQQGFDQRGELF